MRSVRRWHVLPAQPHHGANAFDVLSQHPRRVLSSAQGVAAAGACRMTSTSPGEDAGKGADATFDELLRFTFPLRLVSNAREHWRTHAARVKAERKALHYEWVAAEGRPLAPGETADVLLTRVATKFMDAHENLPHAFKAVVDQIAAELGLPKQDNSPRLTW